MIIEVDYGITKEKKDTGKPLRLEAFNFLKFAIGKYQFDPFYHELMQICLERIGTSLLILEKENSPDLILKRINTIKLLCQKDFSHFISLQNDFCKKISLDGGILKAYSTSDKVSDERTEVFLKGLFKEIL